MSRELQDFRVREESQNPGVGWGEVRGSPLSPENASLTSVLQPTLTGRAADRDKAVLLRTGKVEGLSLLACLNPRLQTPGN